MVSLGGDNGSSLVTWRKYSRYIYYACLLVYLMARRAYAATEEVNGGEEKVPGRYQVAKFNFDHVSDVYAITLWILLGSLAKVGFHLSHKLTEKCPESCLLIILGLVVGGLLYATKLAEQKAYVLNSDTFFLFLLPPIILEAGYFMPNRPFFDNIGTILLFAIANTLFNTICIGLTLWGFSFTPLYGGTKFEMLHCFVFSALVSAVDPVAVLATFVEIHVNDMLYIVVFGESLLNDAVSVVLYRMFDSFAEMGQSNIQVVDLVLGGTSFFIVAFGGVLIGIIFGIIACFTTKFTEHTPVLEPLIILTYSYLSYLTAEMFSTSGILAITFCGMFMKQYVEFNISKKSNATIEYVLKMLASIMETIIFMFMGLSTVSDHHSWNTGFVLITIASCTIYRIIGVIIFANLANRWRLLELKMTDMLIMSYGGIRGAVAFALALILDESRIPTKKEFVTATIAVVFFTVFLQGTTIGPIVKYFKIKRKEIEEPTMSAKLTNRLVDHIMSCLEDIAGVAGKNSLRDKIRVYDRRFIKPFLLREKLVSRDEKLLNTFKKINEMNVSKIAENPEFVLPSTASMLQLSNMQNMRNISVSNLLAAGMTEVSTVPDFQILGAQPSMRADEDARLHHLLESVMYDPRKRQAIHKRSQLDEEPRQYRKPSGKRGGATASGGQNYHHQNPFVLRTLIDPDQINRSAKAMGQKKRSATNMAAAAASRDGSHHVSRSAGDKQQVKQKSQSAHDDRHRSSRPDESSEGIEMKKVEPSTTTTTTSHQTKTTPPPSPATENTNIPPPWKSTINDVTDDEPVKANMPTWANNPDYTLHATTTKPDESHHTPVFEIFDNNNAASSTTTATRRSVNKDQQKDSSAH